MSNSNNNNKGSDIATAVIIILIVLAILIAITAYIGFIVLIIVASIAAAVSFIYALILYMREFRNAYITTGGLAGATSISDFVLKWCTLIKTVSKNSFNSNFINAQNAVCKAKMYKLTSPKKWFWMAYSICLIVFGTALIVIVMVLPVILACALSVIAFLLFCVYSLVIFVGDICYYSVVSVCNSITIFAHKASVFRCLGFSSSSSFNDIPWETSTFFSTLFSILKEIWDECIITSQNNNNTAALLFLISPKRIFLYGSGVALMLFTSTIIALAFILMMLFFILTFIAKLIWTCITSIINH